MKITIYSSDEDLPIVTVEGDETDSPESVAEAYKRTITELEKEEK